MDDRSLKRIVEELEPLLVGRAAGKLFQLGPLSLAIDFRLRDRRSLFLSVEPAMPRIHLIKRGVRDVEKQSVPLGQFALTLRKELSQSTLRAIAKDEGDRIVRLQFVGQDDLQQPRDRTLIAQLTGRSANLFLLDAHNAIVQRLRPTRVRGQQPGEIYRTPSASEHRRVSKNETELFKTIQGRQVSSASEAVDAYYSSVLSHMTFDANASAARADLKKRISHQRKLLKQLENDLAGHADAAHHKRIGDLLLANLSTFRREGKRVTLVDYFDDDASSIEVEIDEQVSLPEEASRRFAVYSRSKRAVGQISSRIEIVKAELAALHSEQGLLEQIIAEHDEDALGKIIAGLSVPPAVAGGSLKSKREKKIPGTRRYVSSDGLEILVGRAARDNDYITFKVARPNDLWLHAADYPGSHVVVRNPTRKEIPHRTIIEAAQLAAHFSHANKDPKVDVHYTQRKFLSKPRSAAPGLVRMSRFKTITVEPRESVKRA